MVEGSQSTRQVIVVESATHITMATGYKANLIRPGEGPLGRFVVGGHLAPDVMAGGIVCVRVFFNYKYKYNI